MSSLMAFLRRGLTRTTVAMPSASVGADVLGVGRAGGGAAPWRHHTDGHGLQPAPPCTSAPRPTTSWWPAPCWPACCCWPGRSSAEPTAAALRTPPRSPRARRRARRPRRSGARVGANGGSPSASHRAARPRMPPLLGRRDGLGRVAEGQRRAGLDLADHDVAAPGADEVELALPAAPVARQDVVARAPRTRPRPGPPPPPRAGRRAAVTGRGRAWRAPRCSRP